MNLSQRMSDYMIMKKLQLTEAPENISDPQGRQSVAYLEAWMSIIGNLVLSAIKLLLGFMSNSISLIADAVHTASDVLTSLVVLVGFRLSALPADHKHPFGHGRIEYIASLIIAIMLIAIGFGFGKSSIERFYSNAPVQGTWLVAIIMVAAALLKELMSRLSIHMGETIKSSALIADAWHHRTDAIASALVAVAIVASFYGYNRVDAILGIGVSLLIIWTGVEIFREAGSKLIGEQDDKQLEEISALAMTQAGVVGTHDICVHEYGANRMISLHLEIDNAMPRQQAHDLAETVEKLIDESFYARTIVHVDGLRDMEPPIY
ncbi:MAG: cation diffusion facilitator family transporter [Syntrophomonadaceae bacterium]|nr:cation diffusion facilitator family transporter [Syntrophomonadaceae bacterium]